MAVSQQGMIDFTVMYATHGAFERDLDRMRAATAAGSGLDPHVRMGWENFKAQLLVHHGVEDAYLWPRLRRAVAGRPADLALLTEMEAEHARIDPLLAAVDAALAEETPGLVERVHELSVALTDHLRHEEEGALPLIQSVLTAADWRGFKRAMARRQGVKGAAVYIPWVIDGRPLADRRRFLSMMPAPLQLINRLAWEPRYQKRNLWRSRPTDQSRTAQND
ncbi:hemerythrin domain-containing protein [Actinomadura sp. HBU206391]|uniref:hemerythrin domain-containing protein n=1 Tax=Actinomadura sp. HBU206391 TaxID=2731692 RepID=UPI001650BC26|nr:hemerythrin domain-containing protein [Actinomadura sp. HBU206391]MBC6456908.1 hemerythrin domain-containing protein [Actinomadura sp. HBU206391]